MVDPASAHVELVVAGEAGNIRACWEDVRQELATADDQRVAVELAALGYTAGELTEFLLAGRAAGEFDALRDALVALLRDQGTADPEAEVERRLRTRRRQDRVAVIQALYRELGRRRVTAGLMWGLQFLDLTDDQFNQAVAALRAGKLLALDEAAGRLYDPSAPRPAPRPREEVAEQGVEPPAASPPALPAGQPTTGPHRPDQETAHDEREQDPDQELGGDPDQ